MTRNTGTSTISNLLAAFFDEPIVPGLPITEQRRIAGRLTTQLAGVDRARQAAAERLTVAAALRQHALLRVFASSAADTWPRVQFRDVLSRPMRTGVSGPEVVDSEMVGLSLAAVRDGALDLTKVKRVNVPTSTDRLVHEGRFYIVRGNGRLGLVGRGGVAPRPLRPIVFPDLLIEAVPNPSVLLIGFLQLIWDTPEVRAQVEAVARTAAGIYKVNLGNLGSVSLPMPTVSEQRRVVAALGEKLTLIDATTKSIEAEIEAIDRLPAALLRRAFEEVAA